MVTIKLVALIAVMGVVACARIAAVPTPAPTPATIPWLALPPAQQYAPGLTAVPNPPIAVPAGAAACTAAQVEGIGLNGGAGMSHQDLPVLLRNRSSNACWLEGYADIAILDAHGRVLARAAGETGRGTFFADRPVARFGLGTGTPPLSPAAPGAALGQAFMNVEWWDCAQPQAAQVQLTLPNGGGKLMVPYVFAAVQSPACGVAAAPTSGLSRGPLRRGGVSRFPRFVRPV